MGVGGYLGSKEPALDSSVTSSSSSLKWTFSAPSLSLCNIWNFFLWSYFPRAPHLHTVRLIQQAEIKSSSGTFRVLTQQKGGRLTKPRKAGTHSL